MRIRTLGVVFVVAIGALLAGCGRGTPPSITAHPAGRAVCAGSSVTLSVTATGTAPLSYQWRKDGTDIPGATEAAYTIASAVVGNAGAYTVVVTNAAGRATSNPATLAVNTAPSITVHPPARQVCLGAAVTLSVTTTGTAPLTYQWSRNGADIPGAVSANLVINAVTADAAGSYTVLVTNACGRVTSDAAMLTVNTPPSITAHPAAQTVRVGEQATFTVAATGTAPLTYQWKRDGVDIAGAARASHTIAAAALADAGAYTVVVTNACGEVTSAAATLTVTPPPVAPVVPSGLVVTVNRRPLGRDVFDDVRATIVNYYARLYAQFGLDIRVFLTGARGRLLELQFDLAALDGLLNRGLVEGEAERRGIVVSPEELEAEFQTQYAALLQSHGITEAELARRLQDEGLTLDGFKQEGRETIAEQLLLQAVERAVVGPLTLTQDELRAYFEERRADYGTEEEVEASHILVGTEAEAKAILAELEAGADFAELARARSTDPGSGALGGRLGWFGRGRMVPEFEEAAFALQVGERSGIVQSQFGFHIILLTNRREATQPGFEEVADRVRADAEAEISGEMFAEWLANAKRTAAVVIHDPLLDAMHKQSLDPDLGIAALVRIRDERVVEERYLSFIIGWAYEERMGNAQAEKSRLEAEPDTPDRAARLAVLDVVIGEARAAALAAYRQALADVGEDKEIVDRIAALEAAAAGQPFAPR